VNAATRIWDAGRPVDVVSTLGTLVRGAGDPAHRIDGAGTFWKSAATPDGDATIAVGACDGVVTARAWGLGAGWFLDRVPALLGEHDDWSGLDLSAHPKLRDVQRQRPGMRLPSTGLVLDALVPAVLEQRVTGNESRRAWRLLVRWFGTPPPGPMPELRVPPPASVLLRIPTWDWHRMGVDGQRARTIRAAATVAHRLEECVALESTAALARLRVVPGIGVWTAAETLQRACGDPDAISIGDYHIKDIVVHYFTGRARGDDDEMCALLAPWAGQRQRVVRLVELSGVGKPRFGPRYAPLDMRAM
jgi:3-methyladenine DNA glycosylase/8-oxoguanine DNA glycosylase